MHIVNRSLKNLPVDVGKLKRAEQWSAALRSMINTDAESARKITSGYVIADRNPDFAVRRKIKTGRFGTLNAGTTIAIVTVRV